MSAIAFAVYRKAEPQGSKHAFVVPGKNGAKPRAVVVDNNKTSMRSYRQDLRNEALIAMGKRVLPLAGPHEPLEVTVEFMFVKPESAKKRYWPVVKPDIDKLLRSTLDALTGVLFADDSQVVRVVMEKVYGPMEKVHVSAMTL